MNSVPTYSPSSEAASLNSAGAVIRDLVANMPIVLFVRTLRAALKRSA
ncbi:hypothetical protein QTI66_02855 [Variovorax sp. J22R133]|nr:hypothetical protein [Variovorax sp. J22R133]MDM0111068.1 hypothetical protein [Variovorax sp. J22R133]